MKYNSLNDCSLCLRNLVFSSFQLQLLLYIALSCCTGRVDQVQALHVYSERSGPSFGYIFRHGFPLLLAELTPKCARLGTRVRGCLLLQIAC